MDDGAPPLALGLALAALVGAGVVALVARRLRERGPPTGLDVLTAFAAMMWVASTASLALHGVTGGDWAAQPGLLVAIAGTGSGALAAAAFCVARAPRPWLGLRSAAPRWWGVALLVVPAFLALSAGWVLGLEALGIPVEPQHLLGLVEAADDRLVVLAALLYGVVGAPLTEEVLFRGLLLGALRDRLGAALAVLVQGLLFGLVHGADPAAIVPLAALGAALGALRVASGSLWPAVAAHAANNAVALGLAVAGLTS